MFALKIFLLSLSVVASTQQDLPVRLPPVSGSRLGENTGTCPLPQNLNQVENDIRSSLDQTVIPVLNNRPVCPCGGVGEWRRIAHLNMSDPNQQCPPNWRLIETPKRTCGRPTGSSGCDSAVFPSNGASYSHVCGRVIAYQRGSPSAFFPSFDGRGLEDVYIDGVSITYGPVGSRQHIWSFVGATHDNPQGFHGPDHNCPCSDINHVWTQTVPAFIQNKYFCDSGNHEPNVILTKVYTSDPLWDGAGCPATSSCCEFNNPPWFCTTLDQATSEDIEVRICLDEAVGNEDVDVELVDIYTM